MKALHIVTFSLLVIGGLNWLLVGLVGWDVGELFGGQAALISQIIYIVVGLSTIFEVATHKQNCKACDEMMRKKIGGGSGTKTPPTSPLQNA